MDPGFVAELCSSGVACIVLMGSGPSETGATHARIRRARWLDGAYGVPRSSRGQEPQERWQPGDGLTDSSVSKDPGTWTGRNVGLSEGERGGAREQSRCRSGGEQTLEGATPGGHRRPAPIGAGDCTNPLRDQRPEDDRVQAPERDACVRFDRADGCTVNVKRAGLLERGVDRGGENALKGESQGCSGARMVRVTCHAGRSSDDLSFARERR
jgi:hypothetical protein